MWTVAKSSMVLLFQGRLLADPVRVSRHFRLPTKMRPTPGPSNLTIRESYESLIAVY